MKKLLNWFFQFFKRERKYRHKIVEELPSKLKLGTLYILDNLGYHWQIVMVCPCGCNTHLHINLVPDHYPHWKYSIARSGRINIRPSLHRKKGCHSHFFVTDGMIEWCD